MNAQDAQQAAAWARTRRFIAETERDLARLTAAGRRAGKESEEAFGGFDKTVGGVVSGLGRMAMQFFAINSAVQLFRKEVDAIKMKNENALNQQLATATAQRRAFMALGPGADLSNQEMIRMMEGQNFVLPQTAYMGAETAFSA